MSQLYMLQYGSDEDRAYILMNLPLNEMELRAMLTVLLERVISLEKVVQDLSDTHP